MNKMENYVLLFEGLQRLLYFFMSKTFEMVIKAIKLHPYFLLEI